MSWPLSQDYNEAIQDPRNSFSDAELKTAEAASNAMGIPMPRSGNFADVYEMRSRSGGHWAVKCFTREVQHLRERYAAISRHLKDANLPFIVDFTFLEQGIRVAGGWYPILKMQWVEGLTLNEFVRQYVDKPAMLQNLLQIWMRMAVRLREAGIAHADLQHGNVLLVPASTGNALAVKLVDYDGMWVPALAGGNSGEVGHPCYQHPQRLAEGTYSLEVDRFPLLMVATALDGLRVGGRALWDRYDSGDNLLFREADLQAPVKSRLFYELLKIGDPRATRLASQTLDALKVRLEAVPLLEELLPELYTPSAPRPAAPVTPKRTTIQVTAADLAAAIQPGVEAPPTRSVWKFGGKDKTSSRRRRKGGLLRRVGCVAGVAVAGLIVAGVVVGLGLRYEATPPKDEVKSVEIESENPPSDTRESTKPPEPKKLNLPRLPWLADKQKPDRPEEQVPPLAAGKAPADKQKTNKPKEQGFVTLFNGKNLDGWKTHPKQPGNWRVVEGTNGKVLTGSGALASYLYSERGDYEDFRLRVEARINDGGNGGIYIRAPFGPQTPAYNPTYLHGYEALINSSQSSTNKTGTLYMSDDGDRISNREAPVPHNQWFQMEVIAQGDRIIVKVNDKTTADYQDPKRRFSSGHIALEQYGSSTEVEFRTIKIEELPAQVASPEPPKRENIAGSQNSQKPEKPSSTSTATDLPGATSEVKPEIAKKEGNNASPEPAKPAVAEGFSALFNGKDLTSWKPHPDDKAKWVVKDGVLIGSGERGHLFSERGDYENFHFRVEAMINDGGMSGQYFRAQFGPNFPKGYEAQINSTASDTLRTGSLMDLGAIVKVNEQLHKPDEWFTQEVIVEGDHIVIKVNGNIVADKHDKRYKNGHLALQVQDAATVVHFRKIEIKELSATVAESAPSRPQGNSRPEGKDVATKAYEKACASARASLLKAFPLALDELAKRKGSTEERVKLIAVVKEEKERFESRGLIPWSEPMRLYVERYLALLVAAQARLSRAYGSLIDAQLRKKNASKVAELQAELNNRLAIGVLARWRHFADGRGAGIMTLYANGKIGNPEGQSTWTYANGVLKCRFPGVQAPGGAWRRTLHVAPDGTTYTGTSNAPPERRPKLAGFYAKDG